MHRFCCPLFFIAYVLTFNMQCNAKEDNWVLLSRKLVLLRHHPYTVIHFLCHSIVVARQLLPLRGNQPLLPFSDLNRDYLFPGYVYSHHETSTSVQTLRNDQNQ